MNATLLQAGSRAVLALALMGAMAVGIIPVASAGQTEDIPVAKVHVGDLDLGTETGAEHMFDRLRSAAAQVCDEQSSMRYPLRESVAIQECEKKAIAPPVRQLDATLLTALFNSHFRNSDGSVVVEPVRG